LVKQIAADFKAKSAEQSPGFDSEQITAKLLIKNITPSTKVTVPTRH
jgi:hypothetical protein